MYALTVVRSIEDNIKLNWKNGNSPNFQREQKSTQNRTSSGNGDYTLNQYKVCRLTE